jgi:hypothetical protein
MQTQNEKEKEMSNSIYDFVVKCFKGIFYLFFFIKSKHFLKWIYINWKYLNYQGPL